MELSLIYSWINFIIFIGLLFYFGKGTLSNFLGDRREGIRRNLEEIAQEHLRVESQYKEYRKKMAEFAGEMTNLIEELRQEGEIERNGIIHKAKNFAHKIREDAKRAGDQELRRTKYLLKQQAFVLAVQKAKEAIQKSIEEQDQVRLLEWGLKSLKVRDHERESLS